MTIKALGQKLLLRNKKRMEHRAHRFKGESREWERRKGGEGSENENGERKVHISMYPVLTGG